MEKKYLFDEQYYKNIVNNLIESFIIKRKKTKYQQDLKQ